MAEEVIHIEVDVEVCQSASPQFHTNLTAHKPSDSDSDYGPGRSFLDKAKKSAEVCNS